MSRPRNRVPSYLKHSSGNTRVKVTLRDGTGKDMLLGTYGSAVSKAEYRHICELVESNDGIYPGGAANDITVAEAILAYVKFASTYYDKTWALDDIKRCLRTGRQKYGSTPAAEFGPLALKKVVEEWVKEGLSRRTVNKMTGTVKRAFKWLVSEELIPADAHMRLQSVEGLRLGRTTAPDNPPVQSANLDDLAKVLPKLPPMVAAVVELQALSGARCGELLSMMVADIDRHGTVWVYQPTTHKGTWRGKGRTIRLGPSAQKILGPWLDKAGDGFVFSAMTAEAERNAVRSANRITPRYPSHMKRNAEKRKAMADRKRPPKRYTTASVRRCLERACEAAGVPKFTPHRLRHLAALKIREEFGLEHTRATLGHTVASMSEHYSREVDAKLAEAVAQKMG